MLHKLPKTTTRIIALILIISSGILIYKIFWKKQTDSQAESTTSISKPIISFLLGIVFEQALILAILGFIPGVISFQRKYGQMQLNMLL